MSAHSRSKRQAMLMYPYPSHYYPQQTPAEPMMPQSQRTRGCATSTGAQGQCLPLAQCYPTIEMSNPAVVNLLMQTLTSCGAPGYYGKQYLQFCWFSVNK